MQEKVYYRVNNILTKEDFIESARFIKSAKKGVLLLSPKGRNLLYLYLSFVAAASVLSYLAYKYNGDSFFRIPAIVLWILLIIIAAVAYAANAYTYGNYNYNTMVKAEGESPINTEIIFTDNRIYTKTKNTKGSIEYNQIINVFDNGDRYYLQIYNTNYLIIKKDCIVFGDKERLSESIKKIKDRINTPNI